MTPDLRKKENLHIVFWLIKDFAWLMDVHWLGVGMALPTFILSCWLTWKSRVNRSDLFHNLAVTCWIAGNSIWMFGEFYCNDCSRPIAMPAFISGFLFIGYYYATHYLGHLRKENATR